MLPAFREFYDEYFAETEEEASDEELIFDEGLDDDIPLPPVVEFDPDFRIGWDRGGTEIDVGEFTGIIVNVKLHTFDPIYKV